LIELTSEVTLLCDTHGCGSSESVLAVFIVGSNYEVHMDRVVDLKGWILLPAYPGYSDYSMVVRCPVCEAERHP